MAYETPSGFKVLNPAPLDAWQGPYAGVTEAAAKSLAVLSIPQAARYITMEVKLIVSGVAKNFWFENGVDDEDLVERYLVDDPNLREDVARKLDVYEVDTFADLMTFISNNETGRCVIFVLSDETYGGLPRLHAYTGSELVQFVTYSE